MKIISVFCLFACLLLDRGKVQAENLELSCGVTQSDKGFELLETLSSPFGGDVVSFGLRNARGTQGKNTVIDGAKVDLYFKPIYKILEDTVVKSQAFALSFAALNKTAPKKLDVRARQLGAFENIVVYGAAIESYSSINSIVVTLEQSQIVNIEIDPYTIKCAW